MPAQFPGNTISKAARAKSGGGFESAIETPAGNILVSGSGFGARSGSIDFYDNYNSYADGTPCGEIGYTQSTEYNGIPAVVSTDSHEGDGKTLEVFYPELGNRFPKMGRYFAPVETLYAAYWFKWTAPEGAGDAGIFKLFRCGELDKYFGEPLFYDTMRSTSGGGIQNGMDAGVRLEDVSYNTVGNRSYTKHANQWHWVEYFCQLSTPGVADGQFYSRVNGQVAFSGTSHLTRQVAESRIQYAIGMLDGRDQDAFDMYVRQSEEYFSESLARVIITDAPIYANSTTWQIQPVVSWSDTQIEVTRQQGALASGTNYLYAWDENDNLVVDAQAVTI